MLRKKSGNNSEEATTGMEENAELRNFINCVLTKYCWADQIRKDERGGARGEYGGRVKMHTRFG